MAIRNVLAILRTAFELRISVPRARDIVKSERLAAQLAGDRELAAHIADKFEGGIGAQHYIELDLQRRAAGKPGIIWAMPRPRNH